MSKEIIPEPFREPDLAALTQVVKAMSNLLLALGDESYGQKLTALRQIYNEAFAPRPGITTPRDNYVCGTAQPTRAQIAAVQALLQNICVSTTQAKRLVTEIVAALGNG